MAKFGTQQFSKPTPATVVKLVAAFTLLSQGLPPIIEASTLITADAKQITALVLDIANVVVAAAAIFFGPANTKVNE